MSKLTTDDFLKGILNERRIKAYRDIAKDYNVCESTIRDVFCLGISFAVANIESDTQALKEELCEIRSGEAIMIETAIAHTKRLEEKIAELEKENKKLRFQILYGGR